MVRLRCADGVNWWLIKPFHLFRSWSFSSGVDKSSVTEEMVLFTESSHGWERSSRLNEKNDKRFTYSPSIPHIWVHGGCDWPSCETVLPRIFVLDFSSLTMLSMAVWCFRKNGRIMRLYSMSEPFHFTGAMHQTKNRHCRHTRREDLTWRGGLCPVSAYRESHKLFPKIQIGIFAMSKIAIFRSWTSQILRFVNKSNEVRQKYSCLSKITLS